MHYADEGHGEPILFVHGTPSWSFDFRHIILRLRNQYRCIAPDHIGFGLSGKPRQYPYTLAQHTANLEQFITANVPKPFTLVVHDFGGPIALAYALRHPEHIRRLVILNSWLWSNEQDPDFRRMKRMLKSPLLPLLYRYFNFSPRFVLPASFGARKPDRITLRHYTAPFRNASERNGALGMAYSLLNDQQLFEQLWEKIGVLSEKPALFIWGMKDPVIRPHQLEKFRSAFMNPTVIKLPEAGHFPQEEEPGQVGEAIQAFLKKTG